MHQYNVQLYPKSFLKIGPGREVAQKKPPAPPPVIIIPPNSLFQTIPGGGCGFGGLVARSGCKYGQSGCRQPLCLKCHWQSTLYGFAAAATKIGVHRSWQERQDAIDTNLSPSSRSDPSADGRGTGEQNMVVNQNSTMLQKMSGEPEQ